MSERHRLNELAMSDSGFIFDPVSGATYTTNSTGLAVLDGLKKRLSRDAIVAMLSERWDIGRADLHRDLDEFVQILRRDGLVASEFRL